MTADLLSPSHVAHIHGCGTATVRRAIAAQELPAVAIVNEQGNVVGYGVTEEAARAWSPRPVGRPATR